MCKHKNMIPMEVILNKTYGVKSIEKKLFRIFSRLWLIHELVANVDAHLTFSNEPNVLWYITVVDDGCAFSVTLHLNATNQLVYYFFWQES